MQEPASATPTICYVGLPSSECLRERDDTDLAVSEVFTSEVGHLLICPGWPWLGRSPHNDGQLSPRNTSQVLDSFVCLFVTTVVML